MKLGILNKAVLAVLLILGSFAMIHAGALGRRNGVVPIEVSINPNQPTSNQQVFITVTMSEAPSVDQMVAIGCTKSTAYVNLPSQIVVSAGHTNATFSATTSSAYPWDAQVTATCNAVTAMSLVGGGR